MKALLKNARNVAVAGFFFLLPVFVIFIVVTKAWTSLSSVGTAIAGVFGMKSILGLRAASVSTGLVLVAICYLCGLLVRFSFVAAFSRSIGSFLSKYIPGYETYKAMAEEKLQNKVQILPYQTVLIKRGAYQQPGYIVEENDKGDCVVFLPHVNLITGYVVIAPRDQVQVLTCVTANELQDSLKQMGKGLLSKRDEAVPLSAISLRTPGDSSAAH